MGDGLLLDDLDKFIKSSGLAPFKRPRRYLFVDRIPKNAVNKVLRRELQSLAVTSVLLKV